VFDPAKALDALTFTRPVLSYKGPSAQRDSRELFSALARHRSGGGDLLDLGCGPRDQAPVAEHCGYRYVGVDIAGSGADILGDAHSLPFAESSFDVVLSYAVLEHLHNPFVALAEIRRVLRPGGHCVGTVSLGEPFHDSYFHFTPWGLASVVRAAGLGVEMLWPSRDTLVSLAEMGHYSIPTRSGLRVLEWLERHLPFLTPRRWLRWSEREKRWDETVRGGSLCFVLRCEPTADRQLDVSDELPGGRRAQDP
jgi:SAM-dependent methyltransferase